MYSIYQPVREEVKCSKIFRPWDHESIDYSAQDATISTTTSDNEKNSNLQNCDNDKKPSPPPTPKKGFRRPKSSPKQSSKESCEKTEIRTPEVLCNYPEYAFEAYPIFPDATQTNLIHSFGLTANDPIFLETMAQGYAFEEYARVLSQEQQAKLMSAKKQRPKKYKCPHCDVGFSNNGQLKGHIRIHTGERPFKCDQKDCGKTFTRNEELTRHKRIHSGLRPYPCTHCGKRFGRKDHLKKHSRTHFQPRGIYAVPVMLPFDTWSTTPYPYAPMFNY